MGILEAILLGIVQGLTEFLPVSSSAHLRITSEILGIGDIGATFTAITQLGTEAAVVVFFWKDIVRIIGRWARSLVAAIPRREPEALLGWWIIVGSLPIVVCGLLFEDAIDHTLRSLWFVAAALIVFGVLLGWVDHAAPQHRTFNTMGIRHALLYGFAQALALIPGVSRSGGTITAGRLMGYTREQAAKYSFLLAIPAVLGSGGYKLVKALADPYATPIQLTVTATLVAFLIALIVIKVFMRYISRGSFMPFVIYRICLGSLIMVLLATGVLEGSAAPGASSVNTLAGTSQTFGSTQ